MSLMPVVVVTYIVFLILTGIGSSAPSKNKGKVRINTARILNMIIYKKGERPLF